MCVRGLVHVGGVVAGARLIQHNTIATLFYSTVAIETF